MQQFVYMCLVWPMLNARASTQGEMRYREAPVDDGVGGRTSPSGNPQKCLTLRDF